MIYGFVVLWDWVCPDHSTLWRFRNPPKIVALHATLLQNINEQLAEKSVFIKTGSISIVDASVIKAQRKAIEMTAGNVDDSQVFTELLSGDEEAVYADSAYASGKTEAWLEQKKIENGVMHRAYRNKPLTEKQKQRNKRLSKTRYIVRRHPNVLIH